MERREASIGTCALIGLLLKNKLFVANLGDCKGRIFSFNNNKINFCKIKKDTMLKENYNNVRYVWVFEINDF